MINTEMPHVVEEVLKREPKEWASGLNDWAHMTLRSDMKRGSDFYLISVANWMKLTSAVGGGAPEIPIF